MGLSRLRWRVGMIEVLVVIARLIRRCPIIIILLRLWWDVVINRRRRIGKRLSGRNIALRLRIVGGAM